MHFILPDGHPLGDHYDVVACIGCGFAFADTASSQADYDRYYADSSRYADARTSTGAGAQDWDAERLERTASTIAEYLPDRRARVVDVGCANGGLLRAFGQLGFERLEGIDPARACVAATAAVPNATARVGSLFQLPEESRGADCAILSHVLEHVRDVTPAVATLRSAVRENGIAYVEVPDATRYGECLVAPFQDFNVEHINHFSPVSLANVLRRGGFAVEAVGQKTIEASRGVPYPAVWAIARAAPSGAGRAALVYDNALAPAIAEYIAASSDAIARLDRYLETALAGVPEVIVWGTGQTTLTLLTHTRLGGARVGAFTDSNPLYHGRRLAGRPVVPPEAVGAIDAPILIGSLIHGRAIADRIHELALPNRVIALAA
ncbi:MAG TPA: class I SAM-dependent methyltransferase [Gemmatimonadaceae bacterium]|nr:class I SAM-dependent methyltransferase [Gemmatimonadaceae bacterium]